MGITSYEDEQGNAYYVLVVTHLDGANRVYYVYQAPAEKGIEFAEFQQVGSFVLDKDFQGFGLVTESGTNRIYMIGLWPTTEGASYADYAYLYELNTDTWSLGEELNSHHLVSTGGGAGVMDVHFRYGAGVSVSGNGELAVSATEHNLYWAVIWQPMIGFLKHLQLRPAKLAGFYRNTLGRCCPAYFYG